MIRLLQWLFQGCTHEWEETERGKRYRSEKDKLPLGYLVFCTCKKCGKPKRFKL